jgi:hypothetical protein
MALETFCQMIFLRVEQHKVRTCISQQRILRTLSTFQQRRERVMSGDNTKEVAVLQNNPFSKGMHGISITFKG